jgi:hypothetical protein
MNTRLVEVFSRATPIASLIVWGLVLLRIGGTFSLSDTVETGLASFLSLMAGSGRPGIANRMFWLSGGIWAGAAYVNLELIGLAYVLMALMTLGAAAFRERQHGKFSLSGPTAFIVAMLIVIALSSIFGA